MVTRVWPGLEGPAVNRAAQSATNRGKVIVSKDQGPAMKSLPVVVAVVASLACGCGAEPAPKAPPSTEVAREVTRDVAIRLARSDAALRFGGSSFTSVAAQNLGRFWVVELRAQTGAGVRYAISANDGTIRERSLFQ